MDIHDEIYRNKTPDVVHVEGKATPDSGIEVGSLFEKDLEPEKIRPDTIIEDSEGEKNTPRSDKKSPRSDKDSPRVEDHTLLSEKPCAAPQENELLSNKPEEKPTEEQEKDLKPILPDEGIGEDRPPSAEAKNNDKLGKIAEETREDGDNEAEKEKGDKEDGKEEGNEEEEEPEMTLEEKEEMYESVINGDIDLLDDLMDKPGANINFEWFQENLLMAAIRHRQHAMAEFLIDNGIDFNYQATVMDLKTKNPLTCFDWYTISCRQLAYENEMMEIVELIDELNGDLWPFMKPREREIRLKRPLEEKLRERGEWISDTEEGEEGDDEGSSIVSVNGTRRRRLRKKRGEDDNKSCNSSSSKGSVRKGTGEADDSNSDEKPTQDSGLPPDESGNVERDISSGYDTLSSVSSLRDLSVFDEAPDIPQNPVYPHKYRQTKSSMSRLSYNRSVPCVSTPREPTIPEIPLPGGYHFEKRMWTPPVDTLGKPGRAQSPFSKRHKSHSIVGLTGAMAKENEPPVLQRKRIFSASTVQNKSPYPASYLVQPSKPQYLQKTVRSKTTLYKTDSIRPATRKSMPSELTAKLSVSTSLPRPQTVNSRVTPPSAIRPVRSLASFNNSYVTIARDISAGDVPESRSAWLDRMSKPKAPPRGIMSDSRVERRQCYNKKSPIDLSQALCRQTQIRQKYQIVSQALR